MDSLDSGVSRREFLSVALAAPLAPMLAGQMSPAPAPSIPPGVSSPPSTAGMSPSSLLDVNFARLLARADLTYDRPPARSEEGMPIGNGRMGSLLWTTAAALHFQINRVDVYGNGASTNSFFERHSDYCGGCGFVDIEIGDGGQEVFPASGFAQRLSVYDGRLELTGKGVTARALASPHADVIAVTLADRRRASDAIHIRLRVLRYESQYFGPELEKQIESHTVAVRTRNHRADSRLSSRGERIVLTQEFREADYYNASAIAIGVVGRSARAGIAHAGEIRLTTRATGEPLVILIASAASFQPSEDVAASALEQLEAAARKGYRGLAEETSAWWHAFWSRGFVHLHSDDGEADLVEQHYNYFLYLMAAASRGRFPPKFNGMIWNTGGDLRTWGAQHWFANLSCYYEALPATNRLELMDPAFSMYSGMYDACAVAARQQWGSEGIWIPETVFFNGLAKLPDDVAQEMQELYLLRKAWEERSARFRAFAETKHPHSSRWNWIGGGAWVDGKWIIEERGAGPFGPVTHIFGTTAKVAYLFWRRYEYTLDLAWLRDRAYPMLKGAAELYRNFPSLRKGDDDKYHIHHVNSNESLWGATDTDEDLSALRGLLPAAIRAAAILERDGELRSAWRELLENLAPIPTSDHPGSVRPADYRGPRVFTRGLRPVVRGETFLPDRNSLPMWFFDLCGLESADRERRDTAAATWAAFFPSGVTSATPVSVLSKVGIAASILGRADAVRHLLPNQIRTLQPERASAYRGGGVLANRMTLREGPQALDAQRLGRMSEALHLALLQSSPPGPAEEPVIRVFPAWPESWDAEYTLLARGAFLVTSAMQGGRVGFVELESLAGAECRLRNPWAEREVTLYRDDTRSENLAGSLLRFATHVGERIVVVVSGDTPRAHRRRVL